MIYKVLSLLQPWASLVVMPNPENPEVAVKAWETRPWKPSDKVLNELQGKEILIHASQGLYFGKAPNRISCRELCYKEPFNKYIGGGLGFDKLVKGAIIGKVTLGRILTTEEWMKENKNYTDEYSFGDYSDGRYAWELLNPKRFNLPIPIGGQLNLWNFEMPDHFHIPLQGGGHATVSGDPDPETIKAINTMVELAKKTLLKKKSDKSQSK